MKRYIILALIALTLFSYGAAQQQQNLSNENLTGDDALPELVFEDFDFKKAYNDTSFVIPQVLQNAKRIVFKGDQVKFSDGTKEITTLIDFNKSFEDFRDDGSYIWMFYLKDNDELPNVYCIEIIVCCEVEQMEQKQPFLGEEYAPLRLYVGTIGIYYPKRFNQWNDLRRKLLSNCPSDEDYYNNLEWAKRDKSADDLEEYEDYYSVVGDINQDSIEDLVRYDSEYLTVYCFDAKNAVTFEKTFTIQNENDKSRIESVSIFADDIMVIHTEWINSRGASGSDDYIVRYQDDDLYLIGYNCQYQPYTVESYNLLTYQKTTETGLREGDMKKTTSTLKRLPLKKLSDIKIGEYNCEDYE